MELKYQYRIAGVLISVDAPIEIQDNEAFCLYRYDKQEAEDYRIHMVPVQSVPKEKGALVFENEMNRVYQEGEKCLHLFHIPFSRGIAAWDYLNTGNETILHFLPGTQDYFSYSTGCFNAAGIERILHQFGKYLFHWSYVDYHGQAVLFSAPSGGGKTTQGTLWEKYADAKMINGDRAALEKTEKGYICHGLPIAGSSGVFTNRSCPLCAIFVVHKATENRVTRLVDEKAFEAVFSELTLNLWNPSFYLDAVDFAMQLVNQVPVYRLSCCIDQGAVEAAKKVVDEIMQKENRSL